MKTVVCICLALFSSSLFPAEPTELQRAALFNLARDFARCAAVYKHFSQYHGNASEAEIANVEDMSDGAKTVSAFIFQTIETGRKKKLEEYELLVNAYIDEETSALESLQQQARIKRVKQCAAISKMQLSILNDINATTATSTPPAGR